jgi:hypothetical protein
MGHGAAVARDPLQRTPVVRCVPEGFAAYAKIFHPIFDGPSKDKRVPWCELAERSGIEFHPGIDARFFCEGLAEPVWPKHLTRPGRLDPVTCRVLADILAPFTLNQRCWFYYGGPSINPFEERLYSGELEDAMSVLEEPGVTSLPEYWWPEDRAWCVNSDDDFSFTLIGGSADMIRRSLDSGELEAVSVTPNTRIDWFSDLPNSRRQFRLIAESVLAGNLSLGLAARAMHGLRFYANREFAAILKPFLEIARETWSLPIGAVRDLWAPSALVASDAKVQKIEAAYRKKARQSCRDIVRLSASGTK